MELNFRKVMVEG